MSVAALQLKTQQWLYAYRFHIMGTVALLLAMAVPQVVMADGWDGSFGPNEDMSNNITNSIKALWKSLAAWLLYGGLAGLAISVFAFGGQYWKPIMFVIIIALIGEMVINWIMDIADLGSSKPNSAK